jgi:hypothetical protein
VTKFIAENWLLFLEAIVVICQSGIDGRYVRSFYPPGIVGFILGFGLNLGVDVVAGILGYEFTRHQQDARKSGQRARLLSWLLLGGEFGLLYFAVVFSHRQLELVSPDEPAYLLWSLSAFAPTACFFIGVAQALRDGKFAQAGKKTRYEQRPSQVEQEDMVIPVLAYQCQYCEAAYDTVKKLNGHMRAHPVAMRGNGHEKEKSTAL